MSGRSENRIKRLRQMIDEMTEVNIKDSTVAQVRFFGGAVVVHFAPSVAEKHKTELVNLLNLIFPANGGGLRSGMTSEDFNEVLGDVFLSIEVIAAGCLLGLWKVAESPALTESHKKKSAIPARLVLTSVRLW